MYITCLVPLRDQEHFISVKLNHQLDTLSPVTQQAILPGRQRCVPKTSLPLLSVIKVLLPAAAWQLCRELILSLQRNMTPCSQAQI
jgi:hypothetical protein